MCGGKWVLGVLSRLYITCANPHSAPTPVHTIQTVIISLITGSLFYMLPTTLEGSRSFFGACFMGVLFLAFGGFPQLPATLEMKK